MVFGLALYEASLVELDIVAVFESVVAFVALAESVALTTHVCCSRGA